MRPQHRKFAAEYIKNGGNGVQAVYAAGYKQGYESACVQSSRLLRSAKVQQMIDDHIKKSKMSADGVIETLTNIAESSAPVDGSQRLKALELLGKFHKLFVDKLETTDTSSKDATESALLKSIQNASQRDQISPESAAIQLFSALSDDPALCDLNSWPAEFRPAIQSSLQSDEQPIIDIADQ